MQKMTSYKTKYIIYPKIIMNQTSLLVTFKCIFFVSSFHHNIWTFMFFFQQGESTINLTQTIIIFLVIIFWHKYKKMKSKHLQLLSNHHFQYWVYSMLYIQKLKNFNIIKQILNIFKLIKIVLKIILHLKFDIFLIFASKVESA